MMKKGLLKKVFGVVLSATMMASLMLTGCGSSGSTGDAESTDAGSSVESDGGSDSEELVTVKMVSSSALASMDWCWIYAAQELGYFEEEGIKVELIECTDGSDAKILASGGADFGGFSPSVGLSAADAGAGDFVGVVNVNRCNIFGIAYNEEGGVKDWKDIEGKSIGAITDTFNVLYDPILAEAGVDISTVTYISYGSAEYEALDSNQVPVMGTWLSEYYMCQGMGYDWGYLSGDDILPQIANSLWANKKFAEENPEIVEGFARAVCKSIYACYYNPEAVADMVLNLYPSIEVTWDGAVGAVKGNVAGMMGIDDADKEALIEAKEIGVYDMAVVDQTIENLYNGGAITTMLDSSVYFTNEYVSNDWEYADVEADLDGYTCTSKIYTEAH